MKRYYDLSKQELNDLTSEEIQKYIDIEIAYAGIVPVIKPKMPIPYVPTIQPTEVAYSVSGILFESQSDALKVADMNMLTSDYDYSGTGSDYKWLEPKSDYDGGVKTLKLFKKEDVKAVAKDILASRKVKDAYDSAMKEYKQYSDRIEEFTLSVTDAVLDVRRFFADVDKAKDLYNHYIHLADGDIAIANSFIKDAYKDRQDILDLIIAKEVENEG